MKLREAREADIDALAQLATEAYRLGFAEILEPQALDQRGPAFFAAHLRPALRDIHVAESVQGILGFSKVTTSHLDMLFVAPQAQGSGAGTALLRRAEAQGLCTLECFRDNHLARAFYERRGWTLSQSYEREFIGRRRGFVLYSRARGRRHRQGPSMSLMREETLSCGARAADFLRRGLDPSLAVGDTMRGRAISRIEMLGRGSSSHAGTLLRYAFAAQGGLSVSAAMPSLAANPASMPHMRQCALLAISQSGRSPDLLRYAGAAREAGAYVVGIINADESPLGGMVEHQIPCCAGVELAVVATKSVVMSMLAGLGVLAGFSGDRLLLGSLRDLPARLEQAAACDWSALGRAIAGARAVYFIGRGADLGIAKELALKVAEAVGVPALAFSSAEILHGPLAAVSAQTPVIGVVSDAHGLASVLTALERARGQGALTLLAHGLVRIAGTPPPQLVLPEAVGTLADALLPLLPAYLAIEAAAAAAGRDPDQPFGLSKVTQTL